MKYTALLLLLLLVCTACAWDADSRPRTSDEDTPRRQIFDDIDLLPADASMLDARAPNMNADAAAGDAALIDAAGPDIDAGQVLIDAGPQPPPPPPPPPPGRACEPCSKALPCADGYGCIPYAGALRCMYIDSSGPPDCPDLDPYFRQFTPGPPDPLRYCAPDYASKQTCEGWLLREDRPL